MASSILVFVGPVRDLDGGVVAWRVRRGERSTDFVGGSARVKAYRRARRLMDGRSSLLRPTEFEAEEFAQASGPLRPEVHTHTLSARAVVLAVKSGDLDVVLDEVAQAEHDREGGPRRTILRAVEARRGELAVEE